MLDHPRWSRWGSAASLVALVIGALLLPDRPLRKVPDEFPVQGVEDSATFVGFGPVVMQRTIRMPGMSDDQEPSDDPRDLPAMIRLYETPLSGSFEIVHQGRRVLVVKGQRMRVLDKIPMLSAQVEHFAPDPGEDTAATAELDTDLDGDGVAEFIVSEYTGGANCCFSLHICKVWPHPHYQVLELDYASDGIFTQLDDDPAMEAEVRDFSMDFFYSGPRRGVAPPLKLDFDGRDWLPSAKLMRGAPATEGELEAMVRLWDGFEIDDRGSVTKFGDHAREPWTPLVRLVYLGHADQAWLVLEKAIPRSPSARRAFWNSMIEHLRMSKGWDTLVEMNGSLVR